MDKMDIDTLIEQLENNEIDKPEFYEKLRNSYSYLQGELKKVIEQRDTAKQKLRDSKDNGLDDLKDYFQKQIDDLKEQKHKSKIEAELLNSRISELAAKYNAYSPKAVSRLMDTSNIIYNEDKSEFEKLINDNEGNIISYTSLEDEVSEFLNNPDNDYLVKSKIITDGMYSSDVNSKNDRYFPPDVHQEASEKGLSCSDLIKIRDMQKNKLSYRKVAY